MLFISCVWEEENGMSSHCKPKSIIPITLLMLFGSMLMVIGPVTPFFGYQGSEFAQTEDISVVLSDAEPSYTLNLSNNLLRVGISHLITNDTPVTISGIELSYGPFLEIRNLTRIGSDSLIVEGRNRDWTLNLSKQSGDVELSFVIEYWHYIYPPTVSVAMPVQLFIPGTAIVLIAAYMLLRIEKNCLKNDDHRRLKKREGAFAIIVFVLLSAMLACPYIYGSSHGLFIPITQGRITGYNHSFQLTSSSPSAILDVTSYVPEDIEEYQLRVRFFQFSGGPIKISTTNEQSTLITELANISLFEGCEIDITMNNEDTHNLQISRIDSDVGVSFLIIVEWKFVGPLHDPTIPVILGIMTIIPATLALWRAIWMTKKITRNLPGPRIQ